jgi:phenylacetate-CoA ligase
MGPDEFAEICALINRVRPAALVGYTGLLVDVARYVRENPGALQWKSKSFVTAAEGLMPGQREILEENLVDEVFLSYGSREFMNIGMECNHHTGYHIMTDTVLVEVVGDDGLPLGPGETGRIVVTDMRNATTPFVRYEIGDLGVMAPHAESCPCGRPFPLLRLVEGRMQDVIYTPDGTTVTGLFVSYTARQHGWIEGYQVVQHARDRITLRVLTNDEVTPERAADVAGSLRKLLGEGMQIDVEKVDELERRPSGKVDLVISRMEESR